MPIHSRSQASLRLATLAAGALLAASSFAQESPQDGVYKDHVDWGVMMDMSGPTASSQSVWVKGLQDRIRKINEAGGVDGRKINLLVEDSRYNVANDKIAYEKLVNQTPVIGISGMGTSTSQVALAPAIRNGKVPILSTYTPTKALSEPASPMVYNGFCGYKQMADAGVGFMVDHYKLKNPNVVTVAIESAGGKDYFDYVQEAVKKYGGTAHHVTLKVTAVDATPQVLEVMKLKPDFITIYGVDNTAVLTMKGLQQYGQNIPTYGITYLGGPAVFKGMGPKAGANYNFISCFTPGGADNAPGNQEMMSYAKKVGDGDLARNVNFVAGWITGQMISEALQKAGKEPTRAKLVDALSKGFAVDTAGLTGPIAYTPTDHTGPQVMKMFTYDYGKNEYKAFGGFSDYTKYTR